MASSLILQGGASITKTLQETITQPGHLFVEGDVLRWSNTLNAYTKAQANTALNAEVAGVVSEYIDASNFKITYHGYIEIDAFSARTDPVMFLSADTAGGLTGAPPSAVGTVVKPVLTKNTNSTGYLVMNYLGTQIGGSSTVAVDEIQPVGTIMPYAGTVIPDTWLECDGGSYGITDYPELYEKLLYADGERAPLYGYVVELGMNSSASAYYANLAVGNILLFRQSGSPDATAYDAAGLVVSKTAPSIASPGAYPVTVKILPKYDSVTKKFQFPNFLVTVNTGIVPFTDYTLGTRVTGALANAHSSNFISINKFLTPDLRGRFLLGVNPTAIGETEGDATFISSTGQYTMASIGGEELHTLTAGEMPAHNHSASTDSTGAHTHTAQSAGAHTHTAAVVTRNNGSSAVASGNSVFPVTNADQTITTSSAGAHTHTTDSQGSHSHTVTVQNSGSNTAHNNMPPYLAVRYIIKAKPYTRAAIIDGIDLPYNSLLVRDLRSRNVGGSNSDLVFYTNTSGDAGSGTERMRIYGNGNTGDILFSGAGDSTTTNPLILSVGGTRINSNRDDAFFISTKQDGTTVGYFGFNGFNTQSLKYTEWEVATRGASDTASVTRLYIDQIGNVGIGTQTPAVKLDVVGSLAVSGKATSAATSASDISTTLSTKGYVESTSRVGTTICFSKVNVTNNPTITVAEVPLVVSGALTSNSGSSTVTFTFPTSTTWSGFACRISDGNAITNRTSFNAASSVQISAFNEQQTSLVLIIATRVS